MTTVGWGVKAIPSTAAAVKNCVCVQVCASVNECACFLRKTKMSVEKCQEYYNNLILVFITLKI